MPAHGPTRRARPAGFSSSPPVAKPTDPSSAKHGAAPNPGSQEAAVDWRGRAVAAKQAVRAIRPGDRVFVGSACATPRRLLRELEALDPPPAGVQLVHFLTDGATRELDGRPQTSFRHRVFFVGRDMQALAASSLVDYVPISLAEVPRLLESGRLAFDVALVQVSPPDSRGMCSLGVSVDVTRAALVSARRAIAEINPHMPRTGPASEVPLDRFDQIVAVDDPVIEYLHEPRGRRRNGSPDTWRGSLTMARPCRSAWVACRTRCFASSVSGATLASTRTSSRSLW